MKKEHSRATAYFFASYLTVFFCMLVGLNSSAQTAQQIISKHLQAIGGQLKINAINSYSFEMGSSIVYYKKPGRWRKDFMKDGKIEQTAIYHGEKGWTIFESGETAPAYSGMSFENFLTGQLSNVTSTEYKIESLGADKESDNLLIKITPLVNNSSDAYYTYYINPTTYMITKMRESQSGASYIVHFDNYTTINGIKIPLKITKANEDFGQNFSEVKSGVKINIPLDDKLFMKPILKKSLNGFKGANGKWGYRDENFVTVISPKYDNTYSFDELGLAKVKLNKRLGYIDKTGKEIIPIQYADVQGFYEGLSGVLIDNKWGYMDKTGKLIVPAKYDRIQIFKDGMACVNLGKKWGFIDKNGTEIIPLEYDFIGFFKDGKVSVKKDGAQFFIDKTGNRIN
ncbi:MAG TPA: WG repeat-containing protein [Chitinophagaceae bacterium]